MQGLGFDYILDNNKDKPNPVTLGSISFYELNGKDYVWKSEHQSFCEHVGNEAQPEEQNSIYINRALIVFQ